MDNLLFLNIGTPEIIILMIIGGLPLILIIYCLFDITRSTFKDPINKIIWVIITVFVPVLGSILYLVFGRSQKATEGG
jgi:hypothetical protein